MTLGGTSRAADMTLTQLRDTPVVYNAVGSTSADYTIILVLLLSVYVTWMKCIPYIYGILRSYI